MPATLLCAIGPRLSTAVPGEAPAVTTRPEAPPLKVVPAKVWPLAEPSMPRRATAPPPSSPVADPPRVSVAVLLMTSLDVPAPAKSSSSVEILAGLAVLLAAAAD